MLFCVQTLSSPPKIVEITTKIEKHPPLKIAVTTRAKRLKSGISTSRSISRRGLKSPIQRDVRIHVWGQISNQEEETNKPHISSPHIQQPLNPSTSTQTQRRKVATPILKPKFKTGDSSRPQVNTLMNPPYAPRSQGRDPSLWVPPHTCRQ